MLVGDTRFDQTRTYSDAGGTARRLHCVCDGGSRARRSETWLLSVSVAMVTTTSPGVAIDSVGKQSSPRGPCRLHATAGPSGGLQRRRVDVGYHGAYART